MEYNSRNRAKYLLQIHLIFSTKYRKKILTGQLAIDLKEKMIEISKSSRFEISHIESDIDHVHMLISYEPQISVSQIVRKLKSESTYWIWQNYESDLKQVYWKSKNLWTPAYFCCSIGNANSEKIAEYIKNQG
jgi:putative transposase